MRQRSTAASLRWDFTILVGFLVLVGLLRFAASGVVAAGLAAQTQAVNETWQANDEVLRCCGRWSGSRPPCCAAARVT